MQFLGYCIVWNHSNINNINESMSSSSSTRHLILTTVVSMMYRSFSESTDGKFRQSLVIRPGRKGWDNFQILYSQITKTLCNRHMNYTKHYLTIIPPSEQNLLYNSWWMRISWICLSCFKPLNIPELYLGVLGVL